MFRQSILPLLLALFFIAACGNKDETPAADSNPPGASNPEVTAPESAPSIDVSETELIEMVGYYTARNGGVLRLNLDEDGIAAFADGLQQGLTGTMSFEDADPADIQTAYSEAQARDAAIQSGAAELPAIDNESLRLLGAGLASRAGLGQLGLGPDDAETIARGFSAGASDAEPDPAMQAKAPAFQAFIEKRMAAAQATADLAAAAAAAENIAAGKEFLANLAANDPDVQVTESGLHFKVLEPGTGEKPTMADTVLVHYKGTLIDGTQFDSSYDRGAPATFPLNGVVKGFGEGLTKIGVGGKIILFMPSNLGYGNQPRPGGEIKPGDALVFECELLEVNPG